MRGDEGLAILQEVRHKNHLKGTGKGKCAEALTAEDLNVESFVQQMVDHVELKNAFAAQSSDLFHFIMNYKFPFEIDLEGKLVLFCQVASGFYDELEFSDKYEQMAGFEYPLIYAK